MDTLSIVVVSDTHNTDTNLDRHFADIVGEQQRLHEDLFSFALAPLSVMSIKLNSDLLDVVLGKKRKCCHNLQRILYHIECIIQYTRIMHLQQFFTDSKRLMKYIDACKTSFESIFIQVQKDDVYGVDLHDIYKGIFFVENDVQYEGNVVCGIKKIPVESDDNILILELEVICTIFHCIT